MVLTKMFLTIIFWHGLDKHGLDKHGLDKYFWHGLDKHGRKGNCSQFGIDFQSCLNRYWISNSKREIEIERAKRIFCHLLLPIGKVDKFQPRRFHQNSSQNLITKSGDSRILLKFFKNFDQNTSGKYIRWLKLFMNFDQNSWWKYS